MTALVDVVFLLIIFFLTTSTLVRQTKTDVDLPEQRGLEQADAEEDPGLLVININADGAFIVDGETMTLDRVLAKVRAEADDEPEGASALDTLLRADANAPSENVNALAAGLIDIGVRSWRLATRPPSAFAAGPTAAVGGR